jgi:hypothetical protein
MIMWVGGGCIEYIFHSFPPFTLFFFFHFTVEWALKSG